MKKIFLLLLISIFLIGVFTACNSEGSTKSEDGWETVEPITHGGDYEFDK